MRASGKVKLSVQVWIQLHAAQTGWRMPHFVKLYLTRLDEQSKLGRKREPATGSEHLLVGMKIMIPVLPSIGS